jgi:hypothetical protein
MGVLFALLGLAQLTDARATGAGPRVFGACLLAAGLWFAWRGYLSATVLVQHDRVVTRSFLTIRSYSTADLRDADVEVGRTGFGGFGREYLVLEVSDGSQVRCKELNARPAESPEHPTVVRQAAEAIRRELRS